MRVATDLDRPVEEVLWLAFVGVNGIVRHLGTDIPAAQSAFIRFAFGPVILAPASVVVAALSVTVALGPLPSALWVWVPVPGVQPSWLAGVAALAVLGHYTMMRAFRVAPMAVTQPVVFLQILWASLLGALVFGEAVDGFVICGSVLIVAAISLNTWAEARQERVPPQPEV